MAPNTQLRLYGNGEARTWRVGNEPEPELKPGAALPWMLLATLPVTASLFGKLGREAKE